MIAVDPVARPDVPAVGQDAVLAFLGRADSYAGTGPVERIGTHCSTIFLVADRAYKLKHAIAFAALDYTTVERRERACRAELALNRRTAPDLYLGVLPITRAADGALAFDGSGPTVDWVVVMRRFSQEALFDRMAERGRLTPALMAALGETVARFHAGAEVTPGFGGAAGMGRAIARNHAELLRVRPGADAGSVESLRTASLAALGRAAPLLDRRRAEGQVRRCHGDLRLANICLYAGRPTLFDAIEFSDEVSCTDTLYDLAFLLMDLRLGDREDLAGIVLRHYLRLTGDHGGLPALPLFLSVRAATRCYAVAGAAGRCPDPTTAARLAARAESLLVQAGRYLEQPGA